MKILSFEISRNDASKKIDLNDVFLVYSSKNSTGKTTLLRSIAYALGYEVQNTTHVDFSKYIFKTVVEVNGSEITMIRNGVSMVANNYEYDLPEESLKLHSMLFGTSNKGILENILGSFYIDQDYGWSIIGYGRFAGNILYDLSSLASGLNDFDDHGLNAKISTLSSEIKKYRFVLSTADKKKKFITDENKNITINKDAIVLSNELKEIERKISELDFKISKLSNSIRENNRFSSFISEMKLMVYDANHDLAIPINSDTLMGFDDNNKSLIYRKLILQSERNELKEKKEEIQSKLPTVQIIDDIKANADTFIKEISGVDIPGLKSLVAQLENEKRKCLDELKMLVSFNNSWIDRIIEYAKEYANELGGLSDEYFKDTKYIYAKKRPPLSGAILHKLSLVYHLAVVKVCEEKLGTKLPLIIDSPGGRELTSDVFDATILLLKKYFCDNQIIIASINDISSRFNNVNIYNPNGNTFDFNIE